MDAGTRRKDARHTKNPVSSASSKQTDYTGTKNCRCKHCPKRCSLVSMESFENPNEVRIAHS